MDVAHKLIDPHEIIRDRRKEFLEEIGVGDLVALISDEHGILITRDGIEPNFITVYAPSEVMIPYDKVASFDLAAHLRTYIISGVDRLRRIYDANAFYLSQLQPCQNTYRKSDDSWKCTAQFFKIKQP